MVDTCYRWFQISTLLFCDELSSNIIFDAVTNITFTLISLLKHVLYLSHLKGIRQLFEMIREDWKQINNEYEMTLLLKNADDGKFMGLILSAGIHVLIMSYVVFITTMHNVSNSTTTEDDYMVYSRLKLTYTKNDEKYYFASLMHTYIVVLCGLMTLAGTEATTVLCGHHAFGMIQILRHRVRNAFNDNKMAVTAPKGDRATIEKVIDVAMLHIRVLRYRKLVDESILMGYFFLLVVAMASLSLNLLRFSYAILRFRRLSQILPIAAVIIGHFLYIGLANHLGQMAIDNSAKFFSDTYTGMWYRATVPAQKLLLFIMCHSVKDIVFVFGGIFCPSYEGFTVMTKLSVSYLMVMYSMDI
ncbi:uncharacterized protein LOC143361055 [Halictus rubicundus]|uniref:uncharacterized protein LOC143361055 n=1 Tax=Halictus rubicundus TaxID=77578 RepID=UPI0040352161